MRFFTALLCIALPLSIQNPGPDGGGSLAAPLPCVAPTMTYRWVPNSGCSIIVACATETVSGNNASQTSSGALPTYGATCGPNSTPCLTFNGTSDYIIPTTAIPSGVTAFTLYAVIKPTTVSTDNPIFGGNNNGIAYKSNSSGKMDLSAQGFTGVATGTQTLVANTWYTQVVTFNNGASTTIFYSASGNTLTSFGGGGGGSFPNSTPYLGGIPIESIWFTGSIAEWGYLNSVSTTGIANWSSCHYGV